LMRVKPCSFENSGFSRGSGGPKVPWLHPQKPGKRRLARSTQFSRNRAPGPSSPKAAPSHRRKRLKHPFRVGSSDFLVPPAPSNVAAVTSVAARRLTQRGIPLERTNPCRGKGI
jgi:hypothetical protein